MSYEVVLHGENGRVHARVQANKGSKLPKGLTVGVLLDGRHVCDLAGTPLKRPAGFAFDIALPGHHLSVGFGVTAEAALIW